MITKRAPMKPTTPIARDPLLVAAQALLPAKDNQMETPIEWRALRRAVRKARRGKKPD